MDCIGIGISTMDLMVEVDAFPQNDSKNVATRSHIGGGGPTANAVAALSKLGLQTGLLSTVGDDLFGEANIAELSWFGVDTSGIQIVPAAEATYAHVIVERFTGKRTIILNAEDAAELDPGKIPNRYSRQVKSVILDSRANTSMLTVAERLKARGAKIMFDGGSVQKFTQDILQIADYPIVSEKFALTFFGNSQHGTNVLKLLEFGGDISGITLGPTGSVIACDGEVFEIPAFTIQAVDTTGAGDLFHAGCLYGILQNWDIPAVGQFASAVAALGCLALGARSGIPTLKEVSDFLIMQKVHGHPLVPK
jgi:ribokinase